MSIDHVGLDAIEEIHLDELVRSGVPEGISIEYKRETYGTSDTDKTEALKDISAFANTIGGTLIIGMEAQNGIATRLVGLSAEGVDAEILRLESMARSGIEPQILGLRFRSIQFSNGRSAIVVRIPRSWNPPHRVSARRHNRFYVRNSGGVDEASLEELRSLFGSATTMEERISRFRRERLDRIEAGHGSVPTSEENGRLILHLVPLSTFDHRSFLDAEHVHSHQNMFGPIGRISGLSPRYNLDGFVSVGFEGSPCAYTQVFRNGVVEAVRAGLTDQHEGIIQISPSWLVPQVIDAVDRHLNGLNTIGVPLPILCMITLWGTADARLAFFRHGFRDQDTVPFGVKELLLPETLITSFGTPLDYGKALRPAFDVLWNAAGKPRCTYFNESGNYVPPK